MKIILNFLVINRRIKENESLEKLINLHREVDRLIFFPPKESETNPSFQIFCFDFHLFIILREVFNVDTDYDEENPGDFFDFTVYKGESDFYEIMNQNFEWSTLNLTDLEN